MLLEELIKEIRNLVLTMGNTALNFFDDMVSALEQYLSLCNACWQRKNLTGHGPLTHSPLQFSREVGSSLVASMLGVPLGCVPWSKSKLRNVIDDFDAMVRPPNTPRMGSTATPEDELEVTARMKVLNGNYR